MTEPLNDPLISELRAWVCSACAEWGWPEPPPEYYEKFLRRLPSGLRRVLASGLAEGLVSTNGWRFTPKDQPLSKRPYQWFSERPWEKGPDPNWEYFVQVAEFVRLSRIAKEHGVTLDFEHDGIDLALRRGDEVVTAIEVKFSPADVDDLVKGLRDCERAVDLAAPARGSDKALPKAKYIVKHRPSYFGCSAIGVRLEFRVHYAPGEAFQLEPDVIPWL